MTDQRNSETEHTGAPRQGNAEAGMTLLEMLISMALVSILTAAMFQSIGSWLKLAERTAQAVERVSDKAVFAAQLDYLATNLISNWPEQQAEAFVGGPDGFSGLTATPLEASEPALAFVSLGVGETESGEMALVYASEQVTWPLRTLGSAASFSYLGADNVWRESWPPREVPPPGPFNDHQLMLIPSLPEAIRLSYRTPGGQSEFIILDPNSDALLPFRIEEALGEIAQ